MEKKTFSISEAFKYGLNTVTDRIGFFLGLGAVNGLCLVAATLILIILGVIAALLTYKFIPSECDIPLAFLEGKDGDPRGTVCLAGIWVILRLSTFIFSILREYFSLGWIKVALEQHDVGFSSYRRLFSMGGRLFKAVIASFLYYAMVVLGLVFFIAPGVYLATRYYFYKFVIVDQNASLFDAFKISYQLSARVFWPLLGFAVLVLVVNALGMLVFGLGWLFTYPVTLLAQAYVYRKLQSYGIEERTV